MWKSSGVVSLLVILLIIGGTECISDKRIIFQDGYSIHELPPTSGEPLLVNFSVNLRNILGVNEKDQYISLETSLRMFWKDTRVKVDDSLLAADKDYVSLNPKVMLQQPSQISLHSINHQISRSRTVSGFRTFSSTAPES